MSIKLQIDFIANRCNHWPYIKIQFNGNTLYDQQLSKETTVLCDLNDIADTNTLEIIHHSKKQGENKVWDTKTDSQGIIVEDCNFQIVNLKINNVSLNEIAFKRFIFDSSQKYDNIYLNNIVGFNGTFKINFPKDIYSWLTVIKYKQDSVDSSEQFSNASQLFHYEQDQQLIKEIKQLLNT